MMAAMPEEVVEEKRQNFRSNLQLVVDQNKAYSEGKTNFTTGLNAYSDYSFTQFKTSRTGFIPQR